MESHGASSGVSPLPIDLTIGPRRGADNAARPVRHAIELGPIGPECAHRMSAGEKLAGKRAPCCESEHQCLIPEVGRAKTTCLALAIALISGAICRGAEPPTKPVLKIALDGGPESAMLKAELTRDWRPNRSVCSTPDAYARADGTLQGLRGIQHRICDSFCITFIPHPEGVDCPAVLIGGKWEQLNPWAFTCETRCLLTLDWMIRRRQWWTSDARDSLPQGDAKDKSLSEEDGGWSGGDDGSSECAPPWAPLKRKRTHTPQCGTDRSAKHTP